jgi:hypothetical protein
LNELRDSSDKLSAAARPPAMPGRAG